VVRERGVVWERGGTPFRQIFWSRNGAPTNIVGHRWNANTEAFLQITSYSLGYPRSVYFLAQIAPKRGIWHQAPQLLGPRSRKPFLQIKIYHYTPANNVVVVAGKYFAG